MATDHAVYYKDATTRVKAATHLSPGEDLPLRLFADTLLDSSRFSAVSKAMLVRHLAHVVIEQAFWEYVIGSASCAMKAGPTATISSFLSNCGCSADICAINRAMCALSVYPAAEPHLRFTHPTLPGLAVSSRIPPSVLGHSFASRMLGIIVSTLGVWTPSGTDSSLQLIPVTRLAVPPTVLTEITLPAVPAARCQLVMKRWRVGHLVGLITPNPAALIAQTLDIDHPAVQAPGDTESVVISDIVVNGLGVHPHHATSRKERYGITLKMGKARSTVTHLIESAPGADELSFMDPLNISFRSTRLLSMRRVRLKLRAACPPMPRVLGRLAITLPPRLPHELIPYLVHHGRVVIDGLEWALVCREDVHPFVSPTLVSKTVGGGDAPVCWPSACHVAWRARINKPLKSGILQATAVLFQLNTSELRADIELFRQTNCAFMPRPLTAPWTKFAMTDIQAVFRHLFRKTPPITAEYLEYLSLHPLATPRRPAPVLRVVDPNPLSTDSTTCLNLVRVGEIVARVNGVRSIVWVGVALNYAVATLSLHPTHISAIMAILDMLRSSSDAGHTIPVECGLGVLIGLLHDHVSTKINTNPTSAKYAIATFLPILDVAADILSIRPTADVIIGDLIHRLAGRIKAAAMARPDSTRQPAQLYPIVHVAGGDTLCCMRPEHLRSFAALWCSAIRDIAPVVPERMNEAFSTAVHEIFEVEFCPQIEVSAYDAYVAALQTWYEVSTLSRSLPRPLPLANFCLTAVLDYALTSFVKKLKAIDLDARKPDPALVGEVLMVSVGFGEFLNDLYAASHDPDVGDTTAGYYRAAFTEAVKLLVGRRMKADVVARLAEHVARSELGGMMGFGDFVASLRSL